MWNLEQTEGIRWEPLMQFEEREINPIDECQKVIDGYTDKPKVNFGGGRAYYSPLQDYVQLPKVGDFKSSELYYGTLFHEFVHSTGHRSRLDRSSIAGLNEFGSKEYSKEELVAEIGASFLCGISGIVNETIDNSASYVQSWLRALKNDVKMVVIAASQAQKAVDYITES